VIAGPGFFFVVTLFAASESLKISQLYVDNFMQAVWPSQDHLLVLHEIYVAVEK
jgi:hypothetical protein